MAISLIANNTGKEDLGAKATVTKPVVATENRQVPAQTGNTLPSEKQTEAASSQLKEKVAELNDYVQTVQRNVQFTVDQDSGDTIVRVVDSATKELIRQIPSEEFLNISQSIREQVESFKGLLFESSI